MDAREGMNSSGVKVVGSDAPSVYRIAPRTENRTQNPNPATASAPSVTTHVGVSPPPGLVAPPPGLVAPPPGWVVPEKRRRGRPRKYDPDGSVSKAWSPKPPSSSAPPPVIDFSAEKPVRIRPPVINQQNPRMEMENLGDYVSCSGGANFTPHVITVDTGEDVTMKVISFSQQGPQAICVLAANGVVSSATLRQPDSSGGTLTYEGRFEILSLTGSFAPAENNVGMRNRSGGMSVSLASPNGRVVGGGIAGLLVAASPVQIVVGSFSTGNQLEQKHKKSKTNSVIPIVMGPTSVIPNLGAEIEVPVNQHHASAMLKQNLASTSAFRGEQNNNWTSFASNSRNNMRADINVTLPG